MLKIFILLFLSCSIRVNSQTITISGYKILIKHKELTLFLDSDTNSYISQHDVTLEQVYNLNGLRKDKWHKEIPYGPYYKSAYLYTGYDLGHLTPSKITMYDDSTNYHTFSMFNQAPQLADFNEHTWMKLEMGIIDTIIRNKTNATIITGVLYDNKNKTYLPNSRIKIPINFYKILILSNNKIYCWIGSNINGLMTTTTLLDILHIAEKNENTLKIKIKKNLKR